MQLPALLLPLLLLLSACVEPAADPDSGGLEQALRPAGRASDTTEVLNCELKNGPTGCYMERADAIGSYVDTL